MKEAATQGRVALITGAGRRIGAAIANKFHQLGFFVAIHCHASKQEANLLLRTYLQRRADSAAVFVADLRQKEAIPTLIADIIAQAGRLDVLVNNASIFKATTLTDITDWDDLFALNVAAPFHLSLAACPHLKQQQGAIINITDIHGISPLKGYAVYCQTKAALMMQTKALATELAPDIRVNAIAPGAILWPEDDNALLDSQKEKILQKTLLKRHGAPEFIADAVWSLVSNPFITGQTLCVDGGRILA